MKRLPRPPLFQSNPPCDPLRMTSVLPTNNKRMPRPCLIRNRSFSRSSAKINAAIPLSCRMNPPSKALVRVKPATIKRRGSAVPMHESKKIFIQSARLRIDRLWKKEFPVNRRNPVSNRPPMERLRNATSTASISPDSSFARTTPNPNMREAVRAYPVPRRCNGLLQFR